MEIPWSNLEKQMQSIAQDHHSGASLDKTIAAQIASGSEDRETAEGPDQAGQGSGFQSL